MKSIVKAVRPIILYYVLALLVVSAAFAEPFDQSSVTATTFDNGLRVITLEDHSAALVALDVWVKAGTLYETKSNNGVSHFLEHLLFKGTARRGEGQADLEIESLGATLDAATSKDSVRLSTVVAGKYFDTALDVIADVTMRAKLDPKHVERERTIILDEISRRDSDPLRALASLVAKASFPNHPYGWPIEGSAANVTAMTVEQVRGFYDTYFVPNNIAVVIVGDISPAKATEAVRLAFAEFKKKDVPPLAAPVEPAPTEVRREKATRETRIAYSALSFPAPGIRDPDEVYAMDVLLERLAVGYKSWMDTTLMVKAEVQAISGDFTTHKDPGNVMFMVGADASALDQVRDALLAKLKEIRETPLTEAEVAAARRTLEGSYAFDTETFSGRARLLGFYESLGDHKFALTYMENIRKVTPEQIRKLAAKYINTEAYVIVEVRP